MNNLNINTLFRVAIAFVLSAFSYTEAGIATSVAILVIFLALESLLVLTAQILPALESLRNDIGVLDERTAVKECTATAEPGEHIDERV
jgi:hypothetical protein